MYTLREHPVTVDWIEKFAMRMLHWAMSNEDALTISEFYINEGVNRRDYNRWLKIYPNLELAHETALQAIGDRRIRGAIKRLYDAGTVKYCQPLFDPDFKELVKLWSEMARLKESNGGAEIHVHMDQIPRTDIVPEKKQLEGEQCQKNTLRTN
jgi:hypothetical protein